MKNLLAVLAVAMLLVTTPMDADAAKRFGGGSSFGRPAPALKQSAPKAPTPGFNQSAPRQQQQAAPAAAKGTAAAAAAKSASPWRNILMGAAAALGITALLSALGLSEGLGQIVMMLLLAMVLFFAFRFVMGVIASRRTGQGAGAANRAAPHASAYEAAPRPQAEPVVPPSEAPAAATAATAATTAAAAATPGSVMDMFEKGGAAEHVSSLSIPEGFDTAGFEKVAKENFIKLQQVWDTGNVIDISDFTTDDFFILVTHKLRERETKQQKSEVIDLTAKLLGFEEQADENIAVVSFNGAMKIDGEFEEVHEYWVLAQKKDGSSGWLLAGIEQAN
ncbi:MAG: Tim44 domain-containing protein [Duodenibacillus sp.]